MSGVEQWWECLLDPTQPSRTPESNCHCDDPWPRDELKRIFPIFPLVLLMYLIIWGQRYPHTQHVTVFPMELWQLCNTGLRFIAYSLTQHNLKQCILKLPGGPHWWGTETLQVGRKKWLKCWWHNCTLIDWFFELCVIWHHWFGVILKHDVTWC